MPLHEMRVAFYSKYIVFHKLCKTYIFAYAKVYVLHKYMFLHMQKYIPCTKHIVCVCKIYSFANVYGFARSRPTWDKPYHEKPLNTAIQGLLQPQGELYPIQTILNHRTRNQLLEFHTNFYEIIGSDFLVQGNFKHIQF